MAERLKRRKRIEPMTEEEFGSYLDEVNRQAEPFIPLFNCTHCGKPIGEEAFVVRTCFDPPLWMHVDCDRG